jgi:hypothetical protein
MEQCRDVHYEIQCENSYGEWTELLQERPKTEGEIPELCDRARARCPGEKIRAVKVTTTMTVEKVSEEPRTGIPAHEVERALHQPHRVHELLQDYD